MQELEERNGKFSFRYFDVDGHFRRHTCVSLLKREAELEQAQFLLDLNKSKTDYNGKYNLDTLLWSHFCKLYYTNHVVANDIEPSAVKTLIKQIDEILHIKYLKELNNENINRFIAERRKSVVPSTTNRQLHVIKSMWTYAINTLELNIKSPAKSIKDAPVELIKNIEFFTNDERKKILNQIQPAHIKTICWLMFSFALRIKEAVSVQWQDINFKTGKIFIYPFKTKRTDPNRISLTMPTDFIAYIKKLPRKSDFICGKDYTNKNARSVISKQIKKRFIEIVGKGRSHMCRHTFVSHAINNPEIKDRDIMKVARIKNPKVLEIYAHYTKEREQTIANNIYNIHQITPQEIDKKIKELLELKSKLTKSK